MEQRWSVIRRRKRLRAALIVMILVMAGLIAGAAVRYTSGRAVRVSGNEERLEFLSSLGWKAEAEPLSEQIILLPKVFPDVLKEYNELQKKQGFDLERYAGKEVTMFTYRLLNYPAEGDVQCSLYQYRDRIVGGDIHSVAIDGFMTALRDRT